MKPIQHLLRILRQIHQRAALYRLHDDDGLAVLAADLVALPGFYGGVLVIDVVKLNLDDFNLGIFGEDLIKNLGFIVEGNAEMANFSLVPQRHDRFIGVHLLVLGKQILILGVHQVKIEIIYAAGFQLLLEEGTDVLVFLNVVAGQLVGQNVRLPGITGSQALFQRDLALAVKIAVGGVKIVEAVREKHVHHFGGFFKIHFLALHGKAHTAKTKIFLHFVKTGLHIGIPP